MRRNGYYHIGILCQAFFCALLFSPAQADPVITPIIVTEQPAGTYSFPIAPVMNAGKSRSDLCYYHSEHTSNTTGSSNIALCDSTAYIWTISAIGSTQHASIQVYCTEAAAGGDPSLADPTTVSVDGIPWYEMTCGAQDPGSWCYGDPDSDGYNQICVAMLNQSIPDPDDASYADDTITAVYGQGARTKKYCASGAYNESTGALTCTDNFLLYGWTSGDRILIQHADINSGTPTWTTVSSKTDKDGVIVASGLAAGPIASGVKIYTHTDPYLENRPAWSFPDMIYTYQNTDDRDQAASTIIPTLTWNKWVAAPLFSSNGFGTRDEDYSLTIHDDVNGISSSALTGTYSDDFWSGARQIFISTSLGTDCANCLTATCGSGCTEISPCQTWACGISQLVRTSGSAVLNVRQGETYDLAADANLVSGDSDHKWINGTSYGSGADPIVETAPTTVEYVGLGGTTTNLRMNNIRFNRTGTCSGGCTDVVSATLHNSLIYRCYFEAGGGSATLDLDGTSLAFLDCSTEVIGTGASFALFAMGGSGLSAHTVRHRAFIGLENLATNSSDAIMRIRGHESIAAYLHNEVLQDDTDQVFAPLRLAQDNHPHYQMQTSNNYLRRSDGVASGATVSHATLQSGGRFDWYLADNNEYSVHAGDLSQQGFDSGGSSIAHLAFYNNIGINTLRFLDLSNGTDLHLAGNSTYTASTASTYLLDSSGSTGYTNVWILNNIASAPASGTSARCVLNDGANASVARTHIHKSMFNYLSVSNAIRIASTNYSPASYETARAGLDVIGGSGGSAVDPLYAAPTTFDLRLCTGTDTPVVGCALSPAIDAGFTDDGLYSSFDGTVRPSGAGYDIGAFEMDTVTGKCCECNGTCTDGITEAACNGLGSTFTAAGTCSGACETGACCTAVEGNCSIITDACCAATWLTGDVCADCVGKCCEADGTCSEVSQTACAAFTNEVFTWGGTCGTCATVACCDGETCADLTDFACAALGFTSAGVGTDCGTGSPCAGPTTGSCCEIDGSCSVTTEAACGAITDAIWSDGGTCSPNICAPAWACCEADEDCTNITSAACTSLGGNWISGVSCSGALCTIGACCENASTCTDEIDHDCDFMFYIGVLCATDPCGGGACCDYRLGNCVEQLTEEECAGTTQTWSDAMDCATVTCGESDIVTNGEVPTGTIVMYPEVTIRPGTQAGRWVFEPQVNLVWLTNASGQSIYAKINDDIEDEASAESGDYVLKIPNGMMAEVSRGGTRKVHVLSVWVPTSGDRDGVGVSVDWRKPQP